VIDLSPGVPKSSGWGVGHEGEPGRYQTFTVPLDDVYAAVDGSIDMNSGWSSEGFEGNIHWLEFETEKETNVNKAVIYFDETPRALPETIAAEVYIGGNWVQVAVLSASEISALTEIHFDNVLTSRVRFTFTQAEGTHFGVRETELLTGP
jgi:hypothetical protein